MARAEHFKKIVNKEKKTVTMILEGCELDAINAIEKRTMVGMVDNSDLYVALMPSRFVAVVKCDDEDTFDEKVGANKAAYRVMEKHKRAFNNAIKRWQEYMIKEVANVNQKTYEELCKSKCKCHKSN